MVTESFQEYKNYLIRLRASTGSGFGYAIIKKVQSKSSPNGIKNLYLRKQIFDFIESDKLLFKAKSYIDNFEDVLMKKFNEIQGGNNEQR
jgi:hypothetical protein